ncbi:hypothetical protein HDU76_003116 [Blyttiomyces sp. JEL0837]|nr:hypothetical protein HDU76_003116 [Blyttiomyces sp. JEL0837]
MSESTSRKQWRSKLNQQLVTYTMQVLKAANDIEGVLKLKSNCIYEFMREICIVLDGINDDSGFGGSWGDSFAQVDNNTARESDLLSLLLLLLHTKEIRHRKVQFKIEDNEYGNTNNGFKIIGSGTSSFRSRKRSVSSGQDSVTISTGNIVQDKTLIKLSVRSVKECVVACKNLKDSKLNLDHVWIETNSRLAEIRKRIDLRAANCWGSDSLNLIDDSVKGLKETLAGVQVNIQDVHLRIVTIQRCIVLWRSKL